MQTNRLMLFRETVAVYCENHTEQTDTVRTSQETHGVSATETTRLMLFRETVAVCSENHTEHTDQVRTSQETHYISATETNRLMLFRETVAVCSEKHTGHTNTLSANNQNVLMLNQAVSFTSLNDEQAVSVHWVFNRACHYSTS
jgi:trehalose/maltose hydrolase-like predicted phosphorylase